MHVLLRLLPAALLTVFGAPASPAVAAHDWSTFQGANTRSGVVIGAPAFQGFRRRFSRAVDGQVYAQPLISGGLIYVATENNTVYAFRSDGATVFRRHLGQPVPGGDLPCGNINPSGISGTPVLAGGRLYVVAYLRGGHRHELFALDARTGRTVMQRGINPPHNRVQQQRGALLFQRGRVYVPYGGLDGDCGDYHGYVLSVTGRGGAARTYANPSAQAGLWATGGVVGEPSGYVLVATGNGTGGSSTFRYANSVLRLSPTLSRTGFWAPRNWLALSASDTDIGSITPALLPGGRVFQSGKDGVGYLLRPGLGGVGGEAFHQHICRAAFGAPAVSPPLVLVPCKDGLVALRVSGDRFSIAWKAGGEANTPLVAGSAAITIDTGGAIRAYRLAGGRRMAQADLPTGASSFPSAAGSGDLLVAPTDRGIVAFGGL